MTVRPLDPFSEVVDERRRWTPDWYGWLTDVAAGAGGAGITALTGEVTATGPGSASATITAGAVTNVKMADMVQSTIKGRAAGSGTGAPVDLTAAQATAILSPFVASGASHLKGLVPDPGATAGIGRYLREDATWAFQRETLLANRDIYVATTGNDANPGTIGSPLLTIQRALYLAYGTLDLAGFNVTIHVGAGTFSSTQNNILAPQVGAGTIMISGNGPSGGSATIISTTGVTFNIVRNAVLMLDNIKMQSSGSYCLVAQQSGIILGSGLGGSTPNLAFGAATFAHMYTASFGTIALTNTPYSIDASVPVHVNANGNGYITYSGTPGNNTVTIGSALNFSTAFAVASNVGYIEASQTTYTGAGYAGTTGIKYLSNYNSLIATAGNMAMPGSVAGSVANFSNYY